MAPTNRDDPRPFWALTVIAILAMALLLAACGGATPTAPVTTSPPPAVASASAIRPAEPTKPPAPTQLAAPTEQPAQTEQPSPTEPAGAGITSEDAPGLNAIDPCALVTKEEAEAVIGEALGEAKREEVATFKSCSYSTQLFDGVSVSVLGFRDAEQAGQAFQQMIDFNDYTEITGIGERAIRTYPFDDITVLVKNFELGINVTNDQDEEAQFQLAQQLAEKALSRLP